MNMAHVLFIKKTHFDNSEGQELQADEFTYNAVLSAFENLDSNHFHLML